MVKRSLVLDIWIWYPHRFQDFLQMQIHSEVTQHEKITLNFPKNL